MYDHIPQVKLVHVPNTSCCTSCHMTPIAVASGSGCSRCGVVMSHMTMSGSEVGLDEAPKGINNVSKDLGLIFLLAHTKRSEGGFHFQ